MGKVTVKIEKVSGGYTAIATDGHQFTKVLPQKKAVDAERLAVKLFRNGIIDWVVPYEQSENEMSGGSWVEFDDSDIEVKSQSTSRPDSFFNSYWFVVVTILAFIGLILLTNRVLGL